MRVLIADDHALFRDGLASLLEAAGFSVVGQAVDGQTAVDLAASLHPDLVLLDLHMPVMNGLEALRQIRARLPEVLVVILTVSEDEQDLLNAVRVGANGYLLKNLNSRGLLDALEALKRGEAAISGRSMTVVMKGLASLSTPAAREEKKPALSERELDVLRLVMDGQPNLMIAERLALSENTVKYHLKNILRKLNARNRVEAVIYAMRDGLLKKDP
jgi:DNA-binding NarL/FixJ family response regulator